MLASYNWLKEYVDFDISPEELAEQMTLHGLEVVNTKPINPKIDGLKVGEVIEKKSHPNADRLSLTRIKYLEAGEATMVQVVCGAANLRTKQKIILATVGTRLAPDFVIKSSKIRGEKSVGMVCSKEELGLETTSEGIWVLPRETALTTDPQSLLAQPDFIFEIEITSNRSDCLNIAGVAREISAILEQPYNFKSEFIFNKNNQTRFKVEVKNDKKCPRYMTCKIAQVKIAESPEWIKNRLNSHGVRPINNVVDATNLMLLEYGQPLHAFDFKKIDEKIIVRNAKMGEKIITLDKNELILTDEDLVISDQNKAIALAGIIGGNNSAIDDSTTDILLEAAVFSPKTIRETSRKHKLDTNASLYYSKTVDLEHTPYVLNQTIQMIIDLTGGLPTSMVSDSFQSNLKEKKILLRIKNVRRTLGLILTKDQIANLLKRLKFKIKASNQEKLEVIVPYYRKDVNYEWDLIEEVARIYGYNNIPEKLPRITNSNLNLENLVNNTFIKSNQLEKLGKPTLSLKKSNLLSQTRNLAGGLGYNEFLTYPFLENQWVEKIYKNKNNFVTPLNPVWIEISLLRNQLLFGLLRSISLNLKKGNLEFNQAYEMGRVFYYDGGKDKYLEEEHLALGIWGQNKTSWAQPVARSYDFYDLSGDLEIYFSQLGFKRYSIERPPINKTGESGENSLFVPTASAVIKINQVVVGSIGLVHPRVLSVFGLNFKIYYAEIDLDRLIFIPISKVKYQKPSNFPAVPRDIAIVINDNLSAKKEIINILNDIKRSSKLIYQVAISSIYVGEGIAKGKCSVVFSTKLRSYDKTLERKEADQEILTIVKKLQKKYDFELR